MQTYDESDPYILINLKILVSKHDCSHIITGSSSQTTVAVHDCVLACCSQIDITPDYQRTPLHVRDQQLRSTYCHAKAWHAHLKPSVKVYKTLHSTLRALDPEQPDLATCNQHHIPLVSWKSSTYFWTWTHLRPRILMVLHVCLVPWTQATITTISQANAGTHDTNIPSHTPHTRVLEKQSAFIPGQRTFVSRPYMHASTRHEEMVVNVSAKGQSI